MRAPLSSAAASLLHKVSLPLTLFTLVHCSSDLLTLLLVSAGKFCSSSRPRTAFPCESTATKQLVFEGGRDEGRKVRGMEGRGMGGRMDGSKEGWMDGEKEGR